MTIPNERNTRARSLQMLDNGEQPDAVTVRSLVEDLQLYQAELETQNEELRSAQQNLEESRRKFMNLFDLAPVGYANIDSEGVILNINLKACDLLSARRQMIQLGRTPLVGFLSGESHKLFYTLIRQTCKDLTIGETEVRTSARGDAARILQVIISCQCGATQDGSCLLCLIDVTDRRKMEHELARKSQSLAEQNAELARFNKIAVGRELRMIELKKEINELCCRLNEPERYDPEGANFS